MAGLHIRMDQAKFGESEKRGQEETRWAGKAVDCVKSDVRAFKYLTKLETRKPRNPGLGRWWRNDKA